MTPILSHAQDRLPSQQTETPAPDGPPVTVHGVVKNAATGQPVFRALVKIDEEQLGALTDKDGRFSIAGVASGLQTFEVTKPGFHAPGKSHEEGVASEHQVRVTADTPDLSFSLAPDNSISGRALLSPSGKPAEGMGIILFERTSSDGRPQWTLVPDGHHFRTQKEYRFFGLEDGTYVLASMNDLGPLRSYDPDCKDDLEEAGWDGFPPIYYPGSPVTADATPVVVGGGQSAAVDVTLATRKLYPVRITQPTVPAGNDWYFSMQVQGRGGEGLRYGINQYRNDDVCVYLPDGAYTLVENVAPTLGSKETRPSMSGALQFSVEGYPKQTLQMPLVEARKTSIYLHYQPGPPKSPEQAESGVTQPLRNFGISLADSPNNPNDLTAEQITDATYALPSAVPGSYWIHGAAGTPGTCLGPVTAASVDLAQSPWTAGSDGMGPLIDVVLRTDCATLTFSMPPTLPAEAAGEGASIYVYAIPEFSSVAGMLSAQLQQFGERSQKLDDITPGTYRVFAFRTPHSLMYRDPTALARFGTGKEITLDAGASSTFVVQEILP
jgi:hypothetical protein